MPQSQLNKPFKFRANIRPVKIAYFLKDDDEPGLVRILQLICTQWGGIRNIIIPVGQDSSIKPVYEHFLRTHEPDWFVSLIEGTEGAASNERLLPQLHKLLPHRQVTLESGTLFEKTDRTAHALDTIPSDLLRQNQLTVRTLAPVDDGGLIGLALYGQIYPGQEQYYEERVNLSRIEEDLESKSFWESQYELDLFASVINLTNYGVAPREMSSGVPGADIIFDVVPVYSLGDLLLYWNLRAMRETVRFNKEPEYGRRIILLPGSLLGRKDALAPLFEMIRERAGYRNISADVDICFACWGAAALENVKAAIADLPLVKPPSGRFSVTHTFKSFTETEVDSRRSSDRPLVYMLQQSPWLPIKYKEGLGQSPPIAAALSYAKNEILFYPPAEFNFSGIVALDFECDVWARYPRNIQIAQAIRPNSWFSKYGLTSVGEVSAKPHYLSFDLPDEFKSLELLFSSNGLNIRLTPASLYAEAVVSLVGGLHEVETLATKRAYQLLDILALKSSKKIAQKVVSSLGFTEEQIPTAEIVRVFDELEVAPELKGALKTYRQLYSDSHLRGPGLLDLIDHLSRLQVLKRGFYITCPNCGTAEWYPLSNASEQLVCLGCANQFVLPARESADTEMQWRYRLNALVNRAMDQDVLPSILAMYNLTKGKEAFCRTFALEILREGRSITDFDFLFVSESEVYAGECKAGEQLGEKDIEAARLAAQLGFAGFHFCTVRQFDSGAIARIEELTKELSQQGIAMKVATLSGSELLGEPLND
jgi:hypothetical protein